MALQNRSLLIRERYKTLKVTVHRLPVTHLDTRTRREAAINAFFLCDINASPTMVYKDGQDPGITPAISAPAAQ